MDLADTPTTWPDGPSISTLHTLAIFAGIPLLVIATVSLLVYAPSWVRGPRYRPGQPWDARAEWFGTPVPTDGAVGRLEPGSSTSEPAAGPDLSGATRQDPSTGGASATW